MRKNVKNCEAFAPLCLLTELDVVSGCADKRSTVKNMKTPVR